MSFLTSWLLNPWMLGLGALAVAVPIIIHLLNKRRFKIVDWAAMDFLFDADKKNRRRVRLENLILLLLRCLAMLLIGLLLARPFIPSSLSKVFAKSQQFEYIVLLDDSFSQQVQVGTESLFDQCKTAIKGLLNRAADSEADETLTLYLTSQPDRPVFSNKPVESNTMSEWLLAIDNLKCSDGRANLVESLNELQSYVASQREDVNRIVYVFTDLRARDWQANKDEQLPADLIKKIAQQDSVAGCYIVDNAGDRVDNLAITSIVSDDLLVANTVIRFDVTVENFGPSQVKDVALRFQVDENPPQTETIAEIPAGKTVTLTFPYSFAVPETKNENDVDMRLEYNLTNHRVRAELVPDARPIDALVVDSQFDFAARTRAGIPVLLVDGEPNLLPERSETHFLASTEVQGTGMIADTVTHTEFESTSLSKYEVIFLCNIGEVSADRLAALEQWVRDGGSLVLMPGGQVRAASFNETFFKNGSGLSPIALIAEKGDPNRQNYCGFDLLPGGHPAFKIAQSLDNIFSSLKIYRWWSSSLAEGPAGADVIVPLRLTDEDRSIAMAEKSFGSGRVVAWSFPADLDWTDWPAHPSYAPVFFDLIHYLAHRDLSRAAVIVGGSVTFPVDLSRFNTEVTLVDPNGDKRKEKAVPVDGSEASKKSVMYQVRFDKLPRRGIYQMQLQRTSGAVQPISIAVNLDPSESDLKRLDLGSVGTDYFGPRARVVTLDELSSLAVTGGHNEIWFQILIALAVILGVEQFLAWWFGRKRDVGN